MSNKRKLRALGSKPPQPAEVMGEGRLPDGTSIRVSLATTPEGAFILQFQSGLMTVATQWDGDGLRQMATQLIVSSRASSPAGQPDAGVLHTPDGPHVVPGPDASA
jgi:hypothetical protein